MRRAVRRVRDRGERAWFERRVATLVRRWYETLDARAPLLPLEDAWFASDPEDVFDRTWTSDDPGPRLDPLRRARDERIRTLRRELGLADSDEDEDEESLSDRGSGGGRASSPERESRARPARRASRRARSSEPDVVVAEVPVRLLRFSCRTCADFGRFAVCSLCAPGARVSRSSPPAHKAREPFLPCVSRRAPSLRRGRMAAGRTGGSCRWRERVRPRRGRGDAGAGGEGWAGGSPSSRCGAACCRRGAGCRRRACAPSRRFSCVVVECLCRVLKVWNELQVWLVRTV